MTKFRIIFTNPNPYLPLSLFFCVLFIFITITTTMSVTESSNSLSSTCSIDSGPVISTTPLILFLEKVQETALNTMGGIDFDPKIYIDMPLKFNLSIVEKGFDDLVRSNNGSVSIKDFNGFLEKYLNKPGSDILYYKPADFVSKPIGFLPKVENLKVLEWALEVHSLWNNLSRKVADIVFDKPELHTLLPLKYPMMVPGSRFIEVYYWDSYWVIRGLLVGKMYETAKSIVYNLISCVNEYGFVLNGGRTYYTNRSQPPLLSSMVFDIFNRTSDFSFLKKSLPALVKEHRFWTSGVHQVTIKDSEGCIHSLSRYYAMWNKPRPESATIDELTASKLLNVSAKQNLYRELASAAESGWDFSTRWMRDHSDLTTLATTSILPVDLNAYVLKMELDIAFLARAIGDDTTAEQFLGASQARQKAITSIFWNSEKEQWFDYWLTNCCDQEIHKWGVEGQNQNAFASNFIPIWVESFHSDHSIVKKLMNSLRSSGLLGDAGIATSLSNSGQQWDFPNGWAPIQHMIVEGLTKSGLKEAQLFAEDIAGKWIRTNYATYKQTGTMHEKYDVEACGKFGGGGEYVPQTGFGWTNGVALAFLEEFGWPEDRKIECSQ